MTAVRRLAADISAGRRGGPRLRQGVVVAVNGNRTCDVTVGGSSVTVAGVPALTGAAPRVGQAVMLLAQARDLVILGTVADNAATGYTPLIQSGSASITLTAAASNSVSVSFDWSFPSAPVVVGVANRGAGNTTNFLANVAAITSSGFNARATTRDGTNTTDTVTFYWSAFGSG